MSDKTNKPKRLTTPAGIGQYVWVNKPDTKFDDDGVYKVSLILEGVAAESLQSDIDDAVDAAWDEKTSDLTAAKIKKLTKAYPYEDEVDDDGNETGRMVFKFKQNAVINSKKKGRIEVKVPVFDAKGKPSKAIVYSGSTLKVSFSMRSYLMESSKSVGVTMDLNAIQVLKLVSGSGGGNADSYGFGEEDGYDSSDEAGSEFADETEGNDGNPEEDF